MVLILDATGIVIFDDMLPIKEKFRDAIKRGTGDAYFILKSNQHVDFSKEILRACLENLAYDPQSEGGRGEYVVRLMELVTQRDKIVAVLLKQLILRKDDSWGMRQLCDIARILASEGNEEARAALYKRFDLNRRKGYKYCGQEAIIDLDGVDGLLKVAGLRGEMLARNHDEWEDESLIGMFNDKYPDMNARAILRRAAKVDANIANYLQGVASTTSLRKRNRKPRGTYQEVAECIKRGVPFYGGVRRLEQSDVKRLASDLLIESQPDKLLAYLRLFSRIEFPLGYGPILKIARTAQRASLTPLLNESLQALRFFENDEIRDYALSNLRRGKSKYRFAVLLIRNYRKGDSKILKTLIRDHKDVFVLEALANICRQIYEHNNTRDSKGPLEAVYDKINCGICRADIVKLMIANGVMSARIKKEIAYDSYEETRALIRAK